MAINLEKYKLKKEDLKKYKLRPYAGQDKAAMLKAEQKKGLTGKPGALDVLKQVPKATSDILLKEPARFAVSTAEAPGTIYRGARKALGMSTGQVTTQKEYVLPGIGSFQSYQSEFEPKFQKAMDPETSALEAYGTAAKPFLQVPLAGLEVMGMAKMGVGDYYLTDAPKKTIKILGKKMVIPGHKAGDVVPGAIPKGISKARKILKGRARKKSINEVSDILKLEPSDMTKKERELALSRSGKPGGFRTVREKGIVKKAEYIPTKREQRAIKYLGERGIINKKMSYPKSVQKVDDEISRVATQELRPYLKANSRKFRSKDIQKLMNEIDDIKPKTFTGEEKKAFTEMKKAIKDIIVDSSDDLDLYDKRILIDDMLNKFKGGRVWDNTTNAGVNAVKDSRRVINNFIARRMPNKAFFGEKMKVLSSLYEAKSILSKRGGNMVKYSNIRQLMMKYPWQYRTLLRLGSFGAGAGGVYYTAKRLF